MTTDEQLAYCNHLEARIAAVSAQAAAFAARSLEPRFILIDAPEVWHIPHPHEDGPPMEWERVFMASMGAAITVFCFATFVALIKA